MSTDRAESSTKATNDALRTIGALFEPGDIIEIRALDVGRTPERSGTTRAGYFNFENSEAIAAAVRSLDGRSEGVYVVLNRFKRELLARSCNELKASPKNLTSDADIVEWRWLYIDVDSIRPAGISATDAEHETALQRAVTIRDYLRDHGWPEPVQGNSGNGGHLLYRLPPLDLKRAGDLVKRCLKALSKRFTDGAVIVDEATATAARICKLYGTMARKGSSVPDRPHRRSALLETPERITPVSIEVLEALASEVPAAATQTLKQEAPSNGKFDIDQWLAHSGFDIVKGPEPYQGGSRWTFRECPFNSEHKKPVVIQFGDGGLVFKCLHNSCAGNDWKALRRLVEPDYRDRSEHANDASRGMTTSDDDPARITDLSQIPSVFTFESQLDWRVDGMLAKGSVTLISAESGTGKTWVGYYLGGCAAHGLPVLGHAMQRCNVLYLDGENPLYVVKQRLYDLGIRETPDLVVWGGWTTSPPVGPDHPLVIEFARKHQGVIIYDSLIEFHPGSEQSSTETRAFMRHFRKLANIGATVIILHHTGKAISSKEYRGSSDIKAAVDTAYLLARAEEQSEELGKLTMTCFKSRLAPGRSFGMEFRKGQGFISSHVPAKTVADVITEILTQKPGSSQSEVVKLGRAKKCGKAELERCLKSGPWRKEDGPNNSILYSLPSADEELQEVEA